MGFSWEWNKEKGKQGYFTENKKFRQWQIKNSKCRLRNFKKDSIL